MIELVRAGRDPEDLAREFEPTSQSIRNWVAQADRSEGRREEKVEPTSSAERDELIKLRREVRQLRLERDILSKPRPGLHARPAQYRPDLRVHEHKPGLVPRCRHGARARRLHSGLLRLA
jgi:transposase-like protein